MTATAICDLVICALCVHPHRMEGYDVTDHFPTAFPGDTLEELDNGKWRLIIEEDEG